MSEKETLPQMLRRWADGRATNCVNCPAEFDGKTPAERYGVRCCQAAMQLDLVRRTEEVCGR